jgi:hypothetical protein
MVPPPRQRPGSRLRSAKAFGRDSWRLGVRWQPRWCDGVSLGAVRPRVMRTYLTAFGSGAVGLSH